MGAASFKLTDTFQYMLVVLAVADNKKIFHEVVVGFKTEHNNVFFILAGYNYSFHIIGGEVAILFEVISKS